MPVEIKELVIRAVVRSTSEGGARPGPVQARLSSAAAPAPSGEQQEAIVEAAVKEVLRILRDSRER